MNFLLPDHITLNYPVVKLYNWSKTSHSFWAKSSHYCTVRVLLPLCPGERKGTCSDTTVIIWGVLYLLGCILWFCHPCQHQSHGGSYSSAINLPSYTGPLAHELDHLWAYYSCTLFGGCGYSKPSRGGNCLASPSAAVALCTWVPPSIWLFRAWYWVRGRTGAGECVLYCFNNHLLMSCRANVLLEKFDLNRWLCIIMLFCNLFYIRNTGKSYPASGRICIECAFTRSSKTITFVSPWWRACVNDKLCLTLRAVCL